jgi:hypothetical protein
VYNPCCLLLISAFLLYFNTAGFSMLCLNKPALHSKLTGLRKDHHRLRHCLCRLSHWRKDWGRNTGCETTITNQWGINAFAQFNISATAPSTSTWRRITGTSSKRILIFQQITWLRLSMPSTASKSGRFYYKRSNLGRLRTCGSSSWEGRSLERFASTKRR